MSGSSRRQLVQELFHRAAEVAETARERFLMKESGGDQSIVSEVLELLAADRLEGEILDKGVLAAARDLHPAAPGARKTPRIVGGADQPEPDGLAGRIQSSARAAGAGFRRIGRYQILEKLGEGGMGEVWLAEQSEPVRRQVALKVIKPGMDTKQVIARFEAERQALAMMDHPAIARIYDAGATPEGQPFFAMELVRGVPITEHCDRLRLSTQERLTLFMKVCEGVQHAHQKAVIHRDLKPSNILVSVQDNAALPKIIDFGVAKAMGQKLTDKTIHTQHGLLIGTPAYMSPEQAQRSGQDVDTRSDVYALGVILYELLVDRRPFDLRERAEDEIYRIIREEEPPRPSQRLSLFTEEERSRFKESRGLDTNRLRIHLQGELDWIALKALEKQRDRRYTTPLDLAADIDRYLGGAEPVVARPPSAIYKLQKFSKRYRTPLTTVTLVFVALVAGSVWALSERARAVGARATAERSREEAIVARDELLGLADTKRLRDARAQLDSLWPLEPARRPLLERWLDELATPLAERLELRHKGALASIRRNARSLSDAEIESDRRAHPNFEALAKEESTLIAVKRRIAELEANPGGSTTESMEDLPDSLLSQDKATLEKTYARLAERVAVLEVEVGKRQTYDFMDANGEPDVSLQWQHDTRADLVAELTRFVEGDRYGDGIASARWRIAEIDRLERESLHNADARALWDACLDDLRQTRAYAGLELEPQFALLPLGRNERTGLWEFVHLATGEAPKPNPKWRPSEDEQTEERHFSRWAIDQTTGVVLVLIPPGSFTMGAERPSLGAQFEEDSLRVTALREGSLAVQAKMAVGDVLLKVSGRQVGTVDEVRAAIAIVANAPELTLTVRRERTHETLRAYVSQLNFDPAAEVDEGPVHEVSLSAYFISKYELTQGQWQRMTSTNPSHYKTDFHSAHHSNTAANPVEQVSWHAVSKWLPRYGLALPTEAQWERAARGGTSTPWWSGPSKESIGLLQAGNLADARSRETPGVPVTAWRFEGWRDDWIIHAPVGRFRANGFGLHDTIGNVWEWCEDNRGDYGSDLRSGDGLRQGALSTDRIRRGGPFPSNANDARVSNRSSVVPENHSFSLGVRPVLRIR